MFGKSFDITTPATAEEIELINSIQQNMSDLKITPPLGHETIFRIMRIAQDAELAKSWCIKFHEMLKPIREVDDEDVKRELATGKYEICGTTDKNHVILVFRSHLHFPRDFAAEITMKTNMYMFDAILCENPNARVTMITDCSQVGWDNIDMGMQRKFMDSAKSVPITLSILQNSYLLDAGFFITMLMRVVKPMMTKEMQDSVKCVTSEEVDLEFGDAMIQRIPTECLVDWVFKTAKTKWSLA